MFLRQKIQQIMLSKRSKAVCSKQGLLPDANSLTSPTAAYLLKSPGLPVGFSVKAPTNCEVAMSPTSILDTKSLSTTRTTVSALHEVPIFTSCCRDHTTQHPRNNVESNVVGLALVDTLTNDESNKRISCAESKLVLFGSQLKVQIPQFSPIEFGINTKNSMLASYSPASSLDPCSMNSSQYLVRRLSASEMELSEDYTRVIAHGPNPRTTHIFDNYIVESCGDVLVTTVNQDSPSIDQPVGAADYFLNYCYACKKNLEQGEDVFMYRGEKAFCSQECRYQELLLDQGLEECC